MVGGGMVKGIIKTNKQTKSLTIKPGKKQFKVILDILSKTTKRTQSLLPLKFSLDQKSFFSLLEFQRSLAS
jgi:hypothetical protein